MHNQSLQRHWLQAISPVLESLLLIGMAVQVKVALGIATAPAPRHGGRHSGLQQATLPAIVLTHMQRSFTPKPAIAKVTVLEKVLHSSCN